MTSFPGLLPIDATGLARRAWLTLVAAGLLVAGVTVSIVLFALTTTSLATIPAGVGAFELLVLVPALGAVAGLYRRWVGALLGRPVEGAYADTTGLGFVERLGRWATDSTRWRDYAHAGFAGTGGAVLVLLVVGSLLSSVNSVVLAITTGGWLRVMFFLLIGPEFAIWWILTPYLMRARLACDEAILGRRRVAELEERVEEVTRTRAETVDHSAAELRRIERDLHDGAQARLVSLGMNLGMASELLRNDPQAAAALLAEARQSTVAALEDLRSVVRDIHPPVLADRGLAGGVEALVLDLALPVTSSVQLPGRLPAPVESAAYFAVAECLANVVKHSKATRAWVTVAHREGRLRVVVGDDGVGGADPGGGSGLAGLTRRLAAFDGTIEVTSPAGGPTTVEMMIPCAL